MIRYAFIVSLMLMPAWGRAATVVVTTDRTLVPGEQAVISFTLAQASDIYGVQLDLGYNNKVLQVDDAQPGKAGIQFLPGDVVPASGGAEVQHQVMPREGRLRWAKSRVWPAEPFQGNGTLISVPVTVLAAGETGLRMLTLKLGTPDGTVITPDVTFVPAVQATGTPLDKQGPLSLAAWGLLAGGGLLTLGMLWWWLRRRSMHAGLPAHG
ncbi:MAG: cohesin domain-containing protein [Alcanivoracaceae bacterium]|nr:cohesin domain-containing protein [Alcanivoracaceae bacterium]